MDKTNWLQGISAAAMAVLMCLGAGYGISEYGDYKSKTQVEQMERLHDRFSSPEMVLKRAVAASKHPEGSAQLLDVFNFFEKVARWHEKGLVDTADVDYYFRPTMVGYWHGFEDWVTDVRERVQDEKMFFGFQRCVGHLAAQPDAREPSEPEIKQFMATEIERYRTQAAMRADPESLLNPVRDGL